MFYMKKLTKMIFSIFLIGTLSFLLLEMIPGDPASAILGVESTPEDIELLREALGLNKSLIVRYLTWGKGVLVGDFGNSFKYSEPVVSLILKRLPLTLEIAMILCKKTKPWKRRSIWVMNGKSLPNCLSTQESAIRYSMR